jgi:thymidylate synthase (FAD)
MPGVTPRVKLIRFTDKPERTVALAAKLCYSDSDIDALDAAVGGADVSRFIAMLYERGHLSTFEHAVFTFGIEGVSRAFLAQITRHRIASFSVQSQRYVNKGGVFNYVVPPAVKALGAEAEAEYARQMEEAHAHYKEWQSRLGTGEKGNEDARFVLPNAAETKLIITMNARELLHFFSLRCCNRAQWEIREVAWQMLSADAAAAPALFAKAGPPCLFGACGEGKMSCGRADEVKTRRGGVNAARRENT